MHELLCVDLRTDSEKDRKCSFKELGEHLISQDAGLLRDLLRNFIHCTPQRRRIFVVVYELFKIRPLCRLDKVCDLNLCPEF